MPVAFEPAVKLQAVLLVDDQVIVVLAPLAIDVEPAVNVIVGGAGATVILIDWLLVPFAPVQVTV